MNPEQIKKLREDTGLNQTQFAQLLGVSSSTVAYWEKGERNPQQIYLASLMKLREKYDKAKNKGDIRETLLKFLLIGGIIAFLVWVFSEEKK